MKRRLTYALSGAGVVAVLFAMLIGGTALAQSGDAGDTAAELHETFKQRLADNLGINVEQLETAVFDTGNSMIDEALADGRITESQAERMRGRLEDGKFSFRFDGHRRHARMAIGHALGLQADTLAEVLGMTEQDLRAEIHSGATLSQVIESAGLTVDEVVNALVAEAAMQLELAVAEDRVTQAQADRILERLPDRLTRAIENGWPECAPWFNAEPEDEETSSGSTT
jgi:hypothetical protein